MLDVILNRRSIRFYKSNPVPETAVFEIIKAGFCSPSAHGKRPWHVVIVRDVQKRKELAALHKWTKHIGFAPMALIVCVDKREMEHFWVEDASAFMTMALLEAENQGLGGCWIAVRGVETDGVNVEQCVRDICQIPNHIGVLAITPIGYPARNPGPHDRNIPDERIHEETFL